MLKYRISRLLRKLLTITKLVNFVWRFIPNGIYVFNYHRIGERELCLYDREVFSCTSNAFDLQLKMIKQKFKLISLEELDYLIKEDKQQSERYALITFDDGYIDNYVEAFPILQRNKVSAAFYVTTDFVGKELVPWWDEMAFLLRKSVGSKYQLPSQYIMYELEPKVIEFVISKIIYEAKRLKKVSTLDVLHDIRIKFPNAVVQFNAYKQRLFMDWAQLKEMTNSGMFIGSHTLSHRVLSKLNSDDQTKELKESKNIIEAELGLTVDSVVYPVGRYHCYTLETCDLAKELGYKFGFNNEPSRIVLTSNLWDLNRFCVGSDSINELKLNVIFNL